MATIATLVITGNPPPSLNQQERMHWKVRQDMREGWEYLAIDAWAKAKWPKFAHPRITYHLYFPDRRKRDQDNYIAACKPILDGLKGRAFGDDDSQSIDLRRAMILYDPYLPRTEIIIEEAGERSGAG